MHFLHNTLVIPSPQKQTPGGFVHQIYHRRFDRTHFKENHFSVNNGLRKKHDSLTKASSSSRGKVVFRAVTRKRATTARLCPCRCLCSLQVCWPCFLWDGGRVHLAVNQPARWRRRGLRMKLHPYALELFSHVTPPCRAPGGVLLSKELCSGLAQPQEEQTPPRLLGFLLRAVVGDEFRGKQQNRRWFRLKLLSECI